MTRFVVTLYSHIKTTNQRTVSNTVICTLAVDVWAVIFRTARRGLGLALPNVTAHTHQRPVYQLHISRRGTVKG